MKQIEEFSKLEKGWCLGEGDRFVLEGLEWFDKMYKKYLQTLPLKYDIFPLVNRNIQVGWETDIYDVELEIVLSTHIGSLLTINKKDGETVETSLDLNEKKSWKLLTNI